MKKRFELSIKFKGHHLQVDGYVEYRRIVIRQVFLANTEIEILDCLISKEYEDLCDLIAIDLKI